MIQRRAIAAPTLILMAAGAAALAVAASRNPGNRALEYMPDMAYSVPYDSFAPNPATRDGKTLQVPVAGTVSRGSHPFRYAASPDDAARAGRELRNPIAATDDTLAAGRAVYETFCFVCHGERGRGDGPLVPRIPTPPSYTSDRVRGMSPGQIFHVISRGSGRMPSYAAQIEYEQRWLVVLYVDALRQERIVPR